MNDLIREALAESEPGPAVTHIRVDYFPGCSSKGFRPVYETYMTRYGNLKRASNEPAHWQYTRIMTRGQTKAFLGGLPDDVNIHSIERTEEYRSFLTRMVPDSASNR